MAGLLGTAAAVALWAPWRSTEAAPAPMLQFDIEAGQNVLSPAISPDGLRIAWKDAGKLWVRRLDSGEAQELDSFGGGEGHPFFSPDGQWIGYLHQRQLRKISVEGGASTVLSPSGSAGGAWINDSSIVLAGNTSGMLRVSATGGEPQPFTELDGSGGAVSHRWPSTLPGGAGVLFTATFLGGPVRDSVRILSPLGGKPRILVNNASTGRYLAPGFLLYYRHGTIFATRVNPKTMEPVGNSVPLVNGVSYNVLGGADYDVSPNGTLVYLRGPARDSRLLTSLQPGEPARNLMPAAGGYWMPRFSPDGTRVALVIADEQQQNVAVYDIARQTLTRLTSGKEPEFNPEWTADSTGIVYQAGSRFHFIPAGGGTPTEISFQSNMGRRSASFSPDGQWFLFAQGERTQGTWIAKVDRSEGKLRIGTPRQLLEGGVARISPDNRWVAFDCRDGICVSPFRPESTEPSERWLVSGKNGGTGLVWTNKELFYKTTGAKGLIEAVSWSATGDRFQPGTSRTWHEQQLATSGFLHRFDISADGKRAVAIFDADAQDTPQTHLRVLLNVRNELVRRLP